MQGREPEFRLLKKEHNSLWKQEMQGRVFVAVTLAERAGLLIQQGLLVNGTDAPLHHGRDTLSFVPVPLDVVIETGD